MSDDQSLHAKVCGTLVGAIVAPRDFEEDDPGFATQREIGGAVQHPTIEPYVRYIEPIVLPSPPWHEYSPRRARLE